MGRRHVDTIAAALAEAKTRYRRHAPSGQRRGKTLADCEIRAFVAGAQWAALPDPEEGCACDLTPEDRGGGHTELVGEMNPACPEHSDLVYDPKVGMWGLRSEIQHEPKKSLARDLTEAS